MSKPTQAASKLTNIHLHNRNAGQYLHNNCPNCLEPVEFTYNVDKSTTKTVSSLKTVYDKLTGMVSPRYALQKFSETGELKEFAKESLGR